MSGPDPGREKAGPPAGRPLDADVELDCRDLRCPLPIIALANRITDVGLGETLAVVANDPAAGADVPAWCRMRGHEYVGESSAPDGVPRFVVRRTR